MVHSTALQDGRLWLLTLVVLLSGCATPRLEVDSATLKVWQEYSSLSFPANVDLAEVGFDSSIFPDQPLAPPKELEQRLERSRNLDLTGVDAQVASHIRQSNELWEKVVAVQPQLREETKRREEILSVTARRSKRDQRLAPVIAPPLFLSVGLMLSPGRRELSNLVDEALDLVDQEIRIARRLGGPVDRLEKSRNELKTYRKNAW